MTAAELIANRADALKPLMGMTVVKGSRPTLAEAKTAKNYLYEDELKTLNRLVSAYLDLAELQALRRKPMFMKDWIARLDDYLQMTDSEVLQNAGSVSHALAEQKAKAEYEKYKRLHRDDVTPVEVAFLDSVRTAGQAAEKVTSKSRRENLPWKIRTNPWRYGINAESSFPLLRIWNFTAKDNFCYSILIGTR